MIFRKVEGIVALWLLLVCFTATAAAQWAKSGKQAQRYQPWRSAKDQTYGPGVAFGASCMAFGPDKRLYVACEKYPALLIFPDDNKAPPQRVTLQGVERRNNEADVDLEAMSILGDSIYLADEDKLCVYSTPLSDPGRVTKLELAFEAGVEFNKDSTVLEKTDFSSIEGMVVTDRFVGPRELADRLGKGPYFYFLDERDASGASIVARLYVGVESGGKIVIAHKPWTFALPIRVAGDRAEIVEGFRLPELFLHDSALYALKTRRPQSGQPGVYQVVRCNLEKQVLEEVVDFSDYANELRDEGFDNNFEGAAPALDGRLFLTADNENYPTGGNGPPPPRPAGRRFTPIVALSAKP